jgi:hypothetical protein
MLFSTPLFLLLFMPLVVTAYVITPRRGRNAVLLAASLLFYAWGEPEIIFVILTSAILDFMLGRCIAAGGPRVSLWLLLGIGTNLGLLFFTSRLRLHCVIELRAGMIAQLEFSGFCGGSPVRCLLRMSAGISLTESSHFPPGDRIHDSLAWRNSVHSTNLFRL